MQAIRALPPEEFAALMTQARQEPCPCGAKPGRPCHYLNEAGPSSIGAVLHDDRMLVAWAKRNAHTIVSWSQTPQVEIEEREAMQHPGATAAQKRAMEHGYGLVQVSAMRWVLVVRVGSGASRGDGFPWRAEVNYRTITRPLERRKARQALTTLDQEAERGQGEYEHAVYVLMTGPHGPNWRR